MYVTDVDKALNMCGLCGVTFDEWREGKVSTFRDGVMAERERIVKLIIDNAHPKGTIGEMLQDNYVLQLSECQEAADLLVALIKGEK